MLKILPAAAAATFTGCVLAIALCACSSSGPTTPPTSTGNTTPTSSIDGSTISNVGDSSTGSTAGTCIPGPGDTGNDKNVGAYCTKGGGQCSNYNNPLLQCSSDLSSLAGNFCLIVGCSQDSDCGTDGCCTAPAGESIKACIPVGCFDSGVCSPIAPN